VVTVKDALLVIAVLVPVVFTPVPTVHVPPETETTPVGLGAVVEARFHATVETALTVLRATEAVAGVAEALVITDEVTITV
jgi:hypothetical protein